MGLAWLMGLDFWHFEFPATEVHCLRADGVDNCFVLYPFLKLLF